MTLLVLVSGVYGAPEIAFEPAVLVFDPVVVGQIEERTLVARNVGDSTVVVSSIDLARGVSSAFDFVAKPFQLAVGDSIAVLVRFAPKTGGSHGDALIFDSNAEPTDPTLPRPVVSLSGTGVGPEISVEPSVINFASSGIGSSVTGTVSVKNDGNDTLRVLSASTGDARFVVDASSFELLPDVSRTLTVTFTPDSSRALVDTLFVVSNDFDEDTLKVVLDAQETPLRVGAARVRLSRVDSVGFPSVGDTISVLLTLEPNLAAVAGMEVFFGYDSTLFRAVTPQMPYTRTGYTQSRLQVLNNAVLATTSALQVAHLSALAGARDSILANGALSQIDLVVVAPLTRTTRLRVLVETPLFNSQYITPGGLSFTSPGTNILGLGNSPPVIRPFPPLKMDEDSPATLGLADLASDAESSVNELTWSFTDPDSLVTVSVSIPDEAIGPVARFFPPENGSGTYAITAMVTDPAGAADSTVVVVDVAPTNDPPSLPETLGPADEATGVSAPLSFQWQGGDPDRDDPVTYSVRFGQNRLFLNEIAQGLTETTFDFTSTFSPETVYFWQVVAKDQAGVETTSPIWQFTSGGDTDPPTFFSGPNILEVTDSTAAVFWSASEASSARIVLAGTADLSDSLNFQALVPDGVLQLRNELIEGLIPGTEYFFQVTLTDVAGNVATGDIASFTTTGSAIVPNDVGDFDGDRVVDFSDFLVFTNAFGSSAGGASFNAATDLNDDGSVGFEDFVIFATVFGTNYALGKPAH